MTEQIQKHDRVCADCMHHEEELGFHECHFKSNHVVGYSRITNKPIFYGYVPCSTALNSFCVGNQMFSKKIGIGEESKSFCKRLWRNIVGSINHD